jgi:lipopolysaccharide transport system permease protein
MVFYGVMPSWHALFIPLFVLLTMLISLAVSLWLAAFFVRFRDIAAAMPLVTQMWMFASPVVYPVSLVPEKWRMLYSLNPMAGVIEGFRWALLGTAGPDFGAMSLNAMVVLVLLVCGIAHFNRVERTFADVI